MIWKYQSTKHNYIRLLFEFENITHLSSWIYEDTAMLIKGKYKNKQTTITKHARVSAKSEG